MTHLNHNNYQKMTNQQTIDTPTDIDRPATYATIRRVLDSWQDTQINLQSESARHILALAIHEQVDSHISQLIEDIVCPERLDY